MTSTHKTPTQKWQMPDTLIIIFFVALFASVLTYIIPAGNFEIKKVAFVNELGQTQTKEVPVPESFKYNLDPTSGKPAANGIPLFAEGGHIGVANFAYNGLTAGTMWGTAVGVIAFILLVGGAFGIILRTGAIDSCITHIIIKSSKFEFLIIPIIFLLFSIGGAVFGMGEEAIAFAMIIVPIIVRLGYDAAVGVMITYVATQIGFATSPINPFSAVIANGIAGLPPVSIPTFKWCLMGFSTLVGILFTCWYAYRVRKNPSKSICITANQYFLSQSQDQTHTNENFGLGQRLVILSLVLAIFWMTYGILDKNKAYFLPEIATIFVVLGLVAGIIGVVFRLRDMRMNDIPDSFVNGAKDLLGAALVVGMAKGIVLILGGDSATHMSVLNTILHSVSSVLKNIPTVLSCWLMFVFQSIFNFFVTSGSGQAALTMPFMAPLADLINVSRNTAVLAFQLGDGLTNIIIPTSGSLIGTLAVARIPWSDWAKFIIRFQALLFLIATTVMIIATYTIK
ncbi:MAG: putative basic amino acid antiporter YfcC [Deltaproteobacteria bacterium]|nr:putative basic amino acid antiporter YfcC [Deltaproteobacteria bacterium]